jgi:hypothetical protein
VRKSPCGRSRMRPSYTIGGGALPEDAAAAAAVVVVVVVVVVVAAEGVAAGTDEAMGGVMDEAGGGELADMARRRMCVRGSGRVSGLVWVCGEMAARCPQRRQEAAAKDVWVACKVCFFCERAQHARARPCATRNKMHSH